MQICKIMQIFYYKLIFLSFKSNLIKNKDLINIHKHLRNPLDLREIKTHATF